ncbi:hypothetical protein CHH28_17215 [Bacterioplanes sanyensis]|uniref:DUF4377 domain-containing protein n=1 Tax=Bacterioplanes sanyensis TaxID=1249553 RepID=A0A222FNE0_9GAMM|nr:DUF4377 domain-containing protein [Bacterioplanes sanyensis]ASP40310.1 hypothetical protein CHH28_17215 [Bacterioplanes sanyensis]
MWTKIGPLLLALLLLQGCQLGRHWSDKEETLFVDYYKVACDDDAARLCYRSREKETNAWREDAAELVEFDQFEWGYRYQLKVETSFNSSGKAKKYRFLNIVKQEAVNSSDNAFALKLDTSTGIVYQSGAQWYLDDKVFTCNTDCTALTNIINNSLLTDLEFKAASNALTLETIKCSAGQDNYDEVCDGKSDVRWEIAHFRSDCGNADGELCLLYRLNSSDKWELLLVDIEGFEHQWGREFEIDVVETRSSANVVTAATLKQDDAAPTDRTGSANDFYMVVQGRLLEKSSGDKVTLYDSTDITLNCGNDCDRLDDYIGDDDWMLLKAYVDNSNLVLDSIACHAETLNLLRQCDENVDWDF